MDGRIRSVSFSLNSEKSVVASVPHFWETARMYSFHIYVYIIINKYLYSVFDPSFSVLLGEAEDKCDALEEDKRKNGISSVVYIAVLVPIGSLIVLGAIGYFFFPKIRTKIMTMMGKKKIRHSISMQPLGGDKDSEL